MIMEQQGQYKEAEWIRKTVGEPLTTRSPFLRLQALLESARPFSRKPLHAQSDRVPVRKTVGQTR